VRISKIEGRGGEQMGELSSLGVIMPVYNEAETLRAALERLLKARLPLDLDVVVVDDGSTDGGVESISDLVEAQRVTLVRHDTNRGKGAAIQTGLSQIQADVVTILDADLEYDPEDYSDLLQPLLEGRAEVVYGTRSFGGHTAYSFWYVIGNRFLALWASFLFNTWLSDIETCFKLALLDIWRSLDIRATGFGIEAEVTGRILKARHPIYEVPINYKARRREEGKKLKWTDGVAALWILLRVRILGR
jgi:glycosyltransferase involved in cell wall biosynthesis